MMGDVEYLPRIHLIQTCECIICQW